MVTEAETPGARPEPSDEQKDAARRAAAELMREIENAAEPPGQLTLSTGIVLRIKPVPQSLVRAAAAKVKPPAVPVIHNEDKGRAEENPSDPDYLAAREQWEGEAYLAGAQVALLMGTECISVPDGYHRPEDDGWLSYLRIVGMLDEVNPDDPVDRYWAWINYYALRTNDDLSLAVYAPLYAMNVSEEEVALAVAAFRRSKERRPDRGGFGLAQDGDRDSVPVADGPRAGDRGTSGGDSLRHDVDGVHGARPAGAGRRRRGVSAA